MLTQEKHDENNLILVTSPKSTAFIFLSLSLFSIRPEMWDMQ